MRGFFRAPKTYVKMMGKKNIYNFTLKIFAYQKYVWAKGGLWILLSMLGASFPGFKKQGSYFHCHHI